jgi:fumarate reductase iron-sulfur subunit
MTIKINRFHRDRDPKNAVSIFEVPNEITLLEAFEYISQKLDPSLSFSSGCRSAVCGSCGVKVNGKEVLACNYRVENGDEVEPLKNLELKKDLVCSREESSKGLGDLPTALDESTCILCNLCWSACPVFELNSDFKGPIFLSRLWSRFKNVDAVEQSSQIASVQKDGVWDCTLCGLCSEVCPQNIDCKNDINILRGVSTQYGFSDPNFSNMTFGFDNGF